MSHQTAPPNPQTLPLVSRLIAGLREHGVRYCHWKSNHRLAEFVRGAGDLDLLVATGHADRFQLVLRELGFVRSPAPPGYTHDSVEHFYGYDAESGQLVHVHAYFRLVTGGLLVKDFELPFADALLQTTDSEYGIPVPDPAAECVVFLIRKLLECASSTERFLLKRSWRSVQTEWRWLQGGGSRYDEPALAAAMTRVLQEHAPELGAQWLADGVAALDRSDWRLAARTGRWLARRIRGHRVTTPATARVVRAARFVQRATARATHRRVRKRVAPRGAVIAITGCDGAGKSTVVRELNDKLGQAWSSRSVHFGRPGIFRLYRPKHRPTGGHCDVSPRGTWRLLARCLLAYERRRAAQRARRQANAGHLVIGDRYPAPAAGPDGPTDPTTVKPTWWNRLLLRVESQLYASIPAPDLQVHLTAPAHVLTARVKLRGHSREATDASYFRKRLVGASAMLGRATSYAVCDANQDPAQVTADVTEAVFRLIAAPSGAAHHTTTTSQVPAAA